MALKDSWQQLRAERQQALQQRRQAVSTLLQDAQTQRQEKAFLLRSDLSLFREMLAVEVASQRHTVQIQNQARQQETQTFLTQARDRRQQQAQETAQQLSEFVDRLQQQTAEFLTVTGAERELMAQQLAYDLQTFRTTLAKTVEILRRRLQAEVQFLQLETQAVIDQAHQQRTEMRLLQIETLSLFVTQLQAEVQQYLANVAIERQERSIELADMLEQSQAKRKLEVQALFERFAEFRAYLHEFVWGEPAIEPNRAIAEKPPVAVKAAPKAPTEEVAPMEPAPSVAKAAPTRGFAPAKQPVVPKKYVQPELIQAIEGVAYEEKIFQYIDSVQEARLTEIESALEMSRYQAIESLRSLIQKGMIVQRDRMYRIAEAFSS